VRAYLTGPLCLESGEHLLAETALPGPQGRHLLGFLVAEHARPWSRDELASQLWAAGPPPAWETSLKSLISKIRAPLTQAGLPGTELIRHAFGAYQFRLPRGGWVDVDAVALGVHLAEAALAAGDLAAVAGHAYVARLITARPFLPGVESEWAHAWRGRLRDHRIRAVECMAAAEFQRGQTSAAIRGAELVLELDELRETAWQILIRAHAAAGNPGSALRAYERCRQTLQHQLGAAPSARTRATLAELPRWRDPQLPLSPPGDPGQGLNAGLWPPGLLPYPSMMTGSPTATRPG
jgi:DNA-binding SARP family transcriptional activator